MKKLIKKCQDGKKLVRTSNGTVVDITSYYGRPGYEKYSKMADEYQPKENPEYNKFIEDLNNSYLSGRTSGNYLNFKNYQLQLPEGYTINQSGVVTDKQGNAYVQAGFNGGTRFNYANNPYVDFTFNQGKPIERNERFYKVNTPNRYVSEPVFITNDEDYYKNAVNDYIKNNTKKNIDTIETFENKYKLPITATYDRVLLKDGRVRYNIQPNGIFAEYGFPYNYSFASKMGLINSEDSERDFISKSILDEIPSDSITEEGFAKYKNNTPLISEDEIDKFADYPIIMDASGKRYKNIEDYKNRFRISKKRTSNIVRYTKPSQQDIDKNVKVNSMYYTDSNGNKIEFRKGGKLINKCR